MLKDWNKILTHINCIQANGYIIKMPRDKKKNAIESKSKENK